jgi:(S)-ureidoglycine aminohydrolase
MSATYFAPHGGHPPQTQLLTDRAVFTDAYAVIPKGTMRDIVTSFLPFWEDTRVWVIARPMSGFAETFSQYIMEIGPGGGSDRPETDPSAEGVLFVVDGVAELTIDGQVHTLEDGGYAYIPPAREWSLRNRTTGMLRFHWIRKAYEAVPGIAAPDVVIANEKTIAPTLMPDTDGKWGTTRFVDPTDLRHDMHVTIVTLEPGAVIPFLETHVMEHGLYVLEGKAVYRLNSDWVEVEEGD